MKRTIDNKLKEWKNTPDRKPLILNGTRQTGKTYSLTEFGKNEFRKIHTINFQKDKTACDIFSGNLSPARILESMEFYLESDINKKTDLVFFDEIQDCPRALTSLKYFCEDMPELAVVSAGSLLGITQPAEPFPVGKVSFLDLYPMSFEEFLLAVKDFRAYDKLQSVKFPDTIPAIIHDHLMERLKEYFVVGGLPEFVLPIFFYSLLMWLFFLSPRCRKMFRPFPARYFFCHREHREKSFLTSVSSVANLFGSKENNSPVPDALI